MTDLLAFVAIFAATFVPGIVAVDWFMARDRPDPDDPDIVWIPGVK